MDRNVGERGKGLSVATRADRLCPWVCRPGFYTEERPPGFLKEASPLSPSSPSAEQRRRPDTLLLWRERERLQQQQQRPKAR